MLRDANMMLKPLQSKGGSLDRNQAVIRQKQDFEHAINFTEEESK